VYLPALFYKLFGLNINLVLIVSIISSVLIGIFSFILGRVVFKDNFYATIVALLVFFDGIPAYVGYTYLNAYFLFLIIAAIFFVKYLKNNTAKWLFWAGIFVGASFIFRFYEVAAASSAFFILIFIQGKFKQEKFSTSLKSASIFCGGILLVVFFAFLPLIKIWGTMIKQTVFDSFSHGTSMNLPYFEGSAAAFGPVLAYLKEMIGGHLVYVIKLIHYLIIYLNVTLLYLLPFILLVVSVWFLFNKKLNNRDKIIVLFFLLWGIFTMPKALGRSDPAHLSLAVTPLFFLLILYLQKSVDISKIKNNLWVKAIKYLLMIITIILVMSLPLFLAQLRSTLMKPHDKIKSEHGTLVSGDEEEVRDVNEVISFIGKNTKKDDYIFVTPWYAPPLYALTDRKNPTYYDSLIDIIASPSTEKQKKICQDLVDKNTKMIIHSPSWGFDNKQELQFLTACPVIQKCIDDNFRLVQQYGRYYIYQPKN
jgi:hypothetical protein